MADGRLKDADLLRLANQVQTCWAVWKSREQRAQTINHLVDLRDEVDRQIARLKGEGADG